MSWLGQLGATVLMFLGSIFGSHSQTAVSPQVPANPPAVQNATEANTTNTAMPNSVAQSSGTQPAEPQSPTVQSLMQKLGCSDANSCISVCMRGGSRAACTQLRALMSAQMAQGRTSSAYTTGTASGPSNNMNGDVAFVGNGTAANAGALPDCPATNALFGASPVRLQDLSGIEPLGHMNGEHILPNQADHVYLLARPSLQSAEVFAPGNATLLQVVEQKGIAGADQGTHSVKLYFSPCKSVMFVFQINTLSPPLQAAIAHTQPSSPQAGATVENAVYGPLNIQLTAGESLGTITNSYGIGAQADFAAADMRSPTLQFIDQNEATGMLANSYAHAVCPLNYFTSSVKNSLESLLTIRNAGANDIPACGSVMQDKPGTAQGNWYNKNDPAPQYQGINESALLAIVHSNLDPVKGVVSVGTDLIPSRALGTQIVFTPASSGFINREPSQVTPDGNTYCFEGLGGSGGNGSQTHVDIQMLSATKLEADWGMGECAATPALSSVFVTYER